MSYCPFCGRKMSGQEIFCPQCGKRLSQRSGVPEGAGNMPRRPERAGSMPRRPEGAENMPRGPEGAGSMPRRPEGAGNAPRRPERTNSTFRMGIVIFALSLAIVSAAIGIVVVGIKNRNRAQETWQPKRDVIYKLEGGNYASGYVTGISGKLHKANDAPPFDYYTVQDEGVSYINYSESGGDGYLYDVENRWGLQLDEPIRIECGGQVTTVNEIGLSFIDSVEYPALKENGRYYCEGTIQDIYQMKLDIFRGNGDKTLIATEKNIDREGYLEGNTLYSSIHYYFPFGNYQLNLSVMKRTDGDEGEQENAEAEPQKESDDSSLTGWAGAERHPDVRYDEAESNLGYMLSSVGQGKYEFRGNCEIVKDYSAWQTGNTYSSSFQSSSSAYTADNPSDLGLLYAAADDYNRDGIADLITVRTEAVTDVSGNPWVYWYWQLRTNGSSSTIYEFGDKLRDAGDVSFAVYDHYLIKVTRDYGVGDLWPLSEDAAEDEDVTFEEIIEVQDIYENFNTVFHCKREAADYLPNEYSYVLETPGEIYYWNVNYSTSDNVSLSEISDEREMITIIEGKLAQLFGKPVVSLSPLRFENRWSALSFAEPSSALQIKTVFDPVRVEDRENGSKKAGISSFTVKTVIPYKGEE